jgi:hypothetical protein
VHIMQQILSIRRIQSTQQPMKDRYEEGGKVGGISFNLQFYFVDTSRVRDGSIPRYRATLDFGLRKRSNPISDMYQATLSF